MRISIKTLNVKSGLDIYIDGEKVEKANFLGHGQYVCDVEVGKHKICFIKKPEILSKGRRLAFLSFWISVFGVLPDAYKEMTKMAEEHTFFITMDIEHDVLLNVKLTKQGKIIVDNIPQHAKTYQKTNRNIQAMKKIKLYFVIPSCFLIAIIGAGMFLLALVALLNGRFVKGICILIVFAVYIILFFHLLKAHNKGHRKTGDGSAS